MHTNKARVWLASADSTKQNQGDVGPQPGIIELTVFSALDQST